MSSSIKDTQALFLRRVEAAAEHQRMVLARRGVVARARERVLPRVDPANDALPDD